MAKRDENDPLTRRDKRRAVAALVLCKSIRAASAKTKINKHRIRRWLRDDPEFVKQLLAASDAVFTASLAQARAATGEAIETLRRLMKSKNERIALEAAREVAASGYDADIALKSKHGDAGSDTP